MSKCTDKDIVTIEALRILKSNALTIKKAKVQSAKSSVNSIYFDEFCKDVINPAITSLYLLTTSTTTTQAYQYPLDIINFTITDIVPGSDVVIIQSGTNNVLAEVS